jgi:hypothetical protein
VHLGHTRLAHLHVQVDGHKGKLSLTALFFTCILRKLT